jgi:hypothetical protein
LLKFVQFDGWHELSLCEERVDLSDELKSDIVLVEDEGVSVLEDDGDLPSLEEDLQLVPVILFLVEVLRVLKRVHLNVLGKVP